MIKRADNMTANVKVNMRGGDGQAVAGLAQQGGGEAVPAGGQAVAGVIPVEDLPRALRFP